MRLSPSTTNRLDHSFLFKGLLLFLVLYTIIILIFRCPSGDETFYLRETYLMSELIKNLTWFGNYQVGLHGFLFKLPVSLIYIISGPSVTTATIFNCILGFLSILLFNRILRDILKLDRMAVYGSFLLVLSYQFLINYPTFLRDIPAVFSFLLFLYALLKGKGVYTLAFLFLLLFEAKEHVFFSIALGYLVFLVVQTALLHRDSTINLVGVISHFFANSINVFSLVILALYLMFFTNIWPLNMFNAYILNITDKSQYMVTMAYNLNPKTSTQNLMGKNSKVVFQISADGFKPKELSPMYKALNIFLRYLGKTVYPRTFGFLAVPLAVFIPSVCMSIHMFKYWIRKQEYTLIALPIIYWTYLTIYMLITGHGRYLFPITPLTFIFYLYLIKGGELSPKFKSSTLLLTFIFVLISIYFEEGYVIIKVILDIILLSCLYLFLHPPVLRRYQVYKHLLFLIVSFCTALPGIAVLFSQSLQGQVITTINFGREYEIKNFLKFADRYPIWVNNAGWDDLPYFYAKDTYIDPEYDWRLDPTIPKKYLLRTWGERKIYNFQYKDTESYYLELKNKDIKNVYVISSELDGVRYPNQDLVQLLEHSLYFNFQEIFPMKNRKVYHYSVN